MKISIITVCFNSALTIEQTIKSVINQTYKDIQYIIIDGGSTDSTRNILDSYASKVIYTSEPDDGIYDAMNKGLSLATGDIVGLLNADDFYVDDTVLSQVAKVFENPSTQACYADLVYVDQNDTSRVIRYWKSQDYKPGLFKQGWMPAHPTFFVRKEVYDKYGKFDLEFPRQADFELTMRFLEVNHIKCRYIPKIWVKMRIGGASNNSINSVIKGNLEAYRACKKHQLNVGPLFILKKVLSRIPQFLSKPERI